MLAKITNNLGFYLLIADLADIGPDEEPEQVLGINSPSAISPRLGLSRMGERHRERKQPGNSQPTANETVLFIGPSCLIARIENVARMPA